MSKEQEIQKEIKQKFAKNCEHRCACKHEKVLFCQRCQVVHCENCNQEWAARSTYTWTYPLNPLYSNQIGVGTTTTWPTYDQDTKSATYTITSTCDHKGE